MTQSIKLRQITLRNGQQLTMITQRHPQIRVIRYQIRLDDGAGSSQIICRLPSANNPTAYLDEIWVKPKYRNQSLGTIMLNEIEQLAIAGGYQFMEYIHDAPKELADWLIRHGYEVVGGRYRKQLHQ